MAITGGTITTDGAYTIHTFTSSGNFVTDQALSVEYLIVGGGGSGGSGYGGGGGAGEFATGTESTLAADSYPIVVGSGGSGVLSANDGNNGASSTFNGIVVVGGGGGGSQEGTSRAGLAGGSGGGGGGDYTGDSGGASNAQTGLGNAGGDSRRFGGGGGGGAGGVGGVGTGGNDHYDDGGDGGLGVTSTISGTAVCYAGGGGGVARQYGTPGTGSCGGGDGGRAEHPGEVTDGTANTGGGGGGEWNTISGAGGDGVVIIRYLTPNPAVEITKSLEYQVLTDTAIQKSLAYEVISPVAITKGLTYAIRNSKYTRNDEASLPADDTNLTTSFTNDEYDDVESDDDVFVDQEAEDYAVFLFKEYQKNNGYWKGKSSLAPSSSTVYLQVYNRDTTSWETLDSNNSASADTEFELEGSFDVADSADYYDANDWVAFRVYQNNT